jgi:hypothetical protein
VTSDSATVIAAPRHGVFSPFFGQKQTATCPRYHTHSMRETAFKVHGVFAENCPVYLSLYKAITITTELLFDPLGSS